MHGRLDPAPKGNVPLRPHPKRICCLLPVWGSKHVEHFLNFSLPTWLAPGNVPALATALPTEFVFLTSQDDAATLTAHPRFRRLSDVCKVFLHPIDHLITYTNHSTTMTLAYAEAVRAFGEDMLDTCFFFLVSDYVMADGSLAAVLRRMQNGASGIQAGNFQLDEDSALPWLKDRIDNSPSHLSLSSREMIDWGLAHLHPVTVASIVNFGLAHNTHTNRLFWRVDGRTLIGRFHLMHMICIRPEVTDFVVGSSCDYSFVPEMCPSGNVEIMTDSDEYLVLEMQPRLHESMFFRVGRHSPRKFGRSLNAWVTAQHLKNAETTIVYHAGEIPANLPDVVGQADRFRGEVLRFLRRKPLPHRGHPYWVGALASFKEATGISLDPEEKTIAFGLPYPGPITSPVARRILWRVASLVFGTPPQMRRWLPLWIEYEMLRGRLDALRKANTRMLMLADRPSVLTVAYAGERITRMRTMAFRRRSAESLAPLGKTFDLCLIETDEQDISRVRALLDRVMPTMRHRATILVSIPNRRGLRRQHGRLLAAGSSTFFHPHTLKTDFLFVPVSRLGYLSIVLETRILELIRKRSIRAGLGFVALAPFFLLSNILSSLLGRSMSTLSRRRHVRSMLVEMVVDGAFSDPDGCPFMPSPLQVESIAWQRIPNKCPVGQPPCLERILYPTPVPQAAKAVKPVMTTLKSV